jgi:hypothetical protein
MRDVRDEPQLRGEAAPRDDARPLTFRELAEVYLDRHANVRSEATIRTLRHRLARPLATYGDVPLAELEGWEATWPTSAQRCPSASPTT